MSGTKKTIIAILAVLVLAGAAAGGYFRWKELQREKQYAEAEALFNAGEYPEAKLRFETLGCSDDMARCDAEMLRVRYEAAVELLEKGDRRAAKAEFEALGDYRDCAQQIRKCDFAQGLELFEAGKYPEAIELLSSLEDMDGAPELIEKSREAIYASALEATYDCRIDEALVLWNSLGDYKDANAFSRRCTERIVRMASGEYEPATLGKTGRDIGKGTIYWHRLGLIYVPKECGRETSCMIFFPGGYDQSLANGYMQDYIYASNADAIMLFCYTNGYYNMDAKIEDAYQALEQAALENNVFLHDLTVCGASMGSYTAVQAAAYLYENYGIAVKSVMSFDAGMHWTVPDRVLSAEQSVSVAGAGTELFLLEGPGIGMNYEAIATMVDNGCSVTVVLCRSHDHYGIIYDAISSGLIDWVLGTGERPENDNYAYIPLYKGSLYPDY